MKILHITDFHYSGKENLKLIQLRLVRSLAKQVKGKQIDLVLFTGDLVHKGTSVSEFEEARATLIEELVNELNLDETKVLIAPGNHDVERGRELADVTESLDEIEDNDKLDSYVLQNDKASLKASLANLEKFYSFLSLFYEKHINVYGDAIVDNMYSSHIREINGKKIGLTVINTAWRCRSSKTDYGNLKYPMHFIRSAYEKIKDTDFKIILMHHPLQDLASWNSFGLEGIIFRDYDMMLSGHTHKNMDTLQLTNNHNNHGIYQGTAGATLSLEKNSTIGFTILEVDTESYELQIENFVFDKDLEEFNSRGLIFNQIPVNDVKQRQNKIRETLKKRYRSSLNEANRLFLSYKQQHQEDDFLELFTEPILKSASQTSISKEHVHTYSIDDLYSTKEDFFIVGRDKSGKSSILYKIFLESIKNFTSNKVIPYYLDCRSYSKTKRKLDVLDVFHDYIELSKNKSKDLLNEYHLMILADNLSDDDVLNSICEFKYTYKNVSVIGSANETLFTSFSTNLNSKLRHKKVFIHDITRSEIRSLAVKWPNIKVTEREVILEKINNLFSQLNIPSNYWTVSLFLWIFEKNSKVNFGNNFQLIELYIDNLLDRQNFVLAEEYKIDFDDLKEYLAEFAFELVKKYKDFYQITYSDWVIFTEDYKSRHSKFVIATEDLIQLVLDKDIVKKEIDKYTFRLNGVFEYFLGLFLSIDEVERNKIIDDDHFYLSFANEFEICAGFIKGDHEYVEKIYNKTKTIFNELNSNYDFEKMDSHLLSKIEDKLNIDLGLPDALRRQLKGPMDVETQDELMESMSPSNNRVSSVKRKKFYEEIELNTDNYEKALHILSRVFRNSKLRNKEKLEDEVFDYILNTTCTLAFALMDELEENKIELIDESTSEEELLRLMTKFVPLMVQLYFYDAVVQSNIENILKKKIEQLKESNTESQFKLLILYFSLLDLNLKEHEHLISDVISILKISVLKNSSLMKLYIYLSLKVNGNSSLQAKIEKHIRSQELAIDSSEGRRKEIDTKIQSVKNDRLRKK